MYILGNLILVWGKFFGVLVLFLFWINLIRWMNLNYKMKVMDIKVYDIELLDIYICILEMWKFIWYSEGKYFNNVLGIIFWFNL